MHAGGLAIGLFYPEQNHVRISKNFVSNIVRKLDRLFLLTVVVELPGEEKGGFLIASLTTFFTLLVSLRLALLCLFVLTIVTVQIKIVGK